MTNALAEAGQLLSEAIRSGLIERGLSSELSLTIGDGRVRIVSSSADVRDAEMGRSGCPPTAPMEVSARSELRSVVTLLHARLQETLR